MRKISLVVSDVDGTLVTTQKSLTPAAIAAAERLHMAGIAFSICSSRPPFGQRMLIAPLRLKLPFGGYNGGSIVNPDLSPVEQKLLSANAVSDAIAMLEQAGISSIWVFTGGEWLIRDRAGDYVDLEIHTIETEPTLVPSFEGRLDTVSKIVGASRDHDRIAAAVAHGQDALRGRATVLRSQPYYLRHHAARHRQGPPRRAAGRAIGGAARGDRSPRRHGQRRRDVRPRRFCDRDGQRHTRGQGARPGRHVVE
jgi:hydroxymethylpyrimidine pyrophosphatase-like HAD family hydrolase